MIDFILEYMANRNVYASSQEEQINIENGIKRYLFENGISENDTGAYYRKYVKSHMQILNIVDLKKYFVYYPVISKINQLVIEYQQDNQLSDKKKADLYQNMQILYTCGLDDKYVPAPEIKKILTL